MPYKNSDGNSSIANEWGQWRYFNSALKKLGNSTPAPVSITPKSPVVEKEINWMNVAGDVINGAMGAFEARRELSYSIADDYMKKHSLQEYQQAMKAGSIPFQDDPIAMQRLKYDHGRLVFQMSEQDFNERVNKGEFVGMEPEQVDAIHYEHSKKSMKEVAEVFGYADGNDYWFNEGFFEDSESNRIKSLLRNSEVTNDTLIQQRLTNDISKVVAMINSGEVAPDAIANIIAETYNQSGYRYTPKDLAVLSKSILEAVGKSPYGDKVLNAIENAEVPGTGVTFKEYIGEAGIEAVKQASQNLRFNIDAKNMYDFKSGVDKIANEGDYATLKTMLADELRSNGNTKTERTEYLFKGIDAAEKAQEKALKAETKRTGFEVASRDWAAYLKDCIDGKEGLQTIEDKKVLYKDSGFTTTHMDQVAQQVVNVAFASGDPKEINKVLTYVAKTHNTYPAFKNYVAKEINDKRQSFSASLQRYVDKGSLDPSYSADKTSDYMYVPKGSRVAITVKDVPESLQTILSVYHNNPSAFTMLADEDVVSQMKLAEMAILLGKNPMNVIGNSERYKKKYAREAKGQGLTSTKPAPLKHQLHGSQAGDLFEGDSDILDLISWAGAIEYLDKCPDDDVKFSDAVKASKTLSQQLFYKVNRFAIPKASIESAFGGVSIVEEQMADVGWCANEAFKNYTKNKGISDSSMSYYDASSDSVIIVDLNGKKHGELKSSDFSKLAYEEYKKDLDRAFYKKWGRK